MNVVDAQQALLKSIKAANIDIAALIASTAIWAPIQAHIQCGCGAKSPHVRRMRGKEKRGVITDEQGNELRLDDNTYPNAQMKAALKKWYNISPQGYETCHVWPETCYDTRYHTCFANLVLLPRAVASFSDFDTHIQQVLQYRAYELFGWHPEEVATPIKPAHYPTAWLEL